MPAKASSNFQWPSMMEISQRWDRRELLRRFTELDSDAFGSSLCEFVLNNLVERCSKRKPWVIKWQRLQNDGNTSLSAIPEFEQLKSLYPNASTHFCYDQWGFSNITEPDGVFIIDISHENGQCMCRIPVFTEVDLGSEGKETQPRITAMKMWQYVSAGHLLNLVRYVATIRMSTQLVSKKNVKYVKDVNSQYDETTLIINHIEGIANACNEIFYSLITCALMCVDPKFKTKFYDNPSLTIDRLFFQNLIAHVNSTTEKNKKNEELYDFHFFLGPFSLDAFTFNTTQSFKPITRSNAVDLKQKQKNVYEKLLKEYKQPTDFNQYFKRTDDGQWLPGSPQFYDYTDASKLTKDQPRYLDGFWDKQTQWSCEMTYTEKEFKTSTLRMHCVGIQRSKYARGNLNDLNNQRLQAGNGAVVVQDGMFYLKQIVEMLDDFIQINHSEEDSLQQALGHNSNLPINGVHNRTTYPQSVSPKIRIPTTGGYWKLSSKTHDKYKQMFFENSGFHLFIEPFMNAMENTVYNIADGLKWKTNDFINYRNKISDLKLKIKKNSQMIIHTARTKQSLPSSSEPSMPMSLNLSIVCLHARHQSPQYNPAFPFELDPSLETFFETEFQDNEYLISFCKMMGCKDRAVLFDTVLAYINNDNVRGVINTKINNFPVAVQTEIMRMFDEVTKPGFMLMPTPQSESSEVNVAIPGVDMHGVLQIVCILKWLPYKLYINLDRSLLYLENVYDFEHNEWDNLDVWQDNAVEPSAEQLSTRNENFYIDVSSEAVREAVQLPEGVFRSMWTILDNEDSSRYSISYYMRSFQQWPVHYYITQNTNNIGDAFKLEADEIKKRNMLLSKIQELVAANEDLSQDEYNHQAKATLETHLEKQSPFNVRFQNSFQIWNNIYNTIVSKMRLDRIEDYDHQDAPNIFSNFQIYPYSTDKNYLIVYLQMFKKCASYDSVFQYAHKQMQALFLAFVHEKQTPGMKGYDAVFTGEPHRQRTAFFEQFDILTSDDDAEYKEKQKKLQYNIPIYQVYKAIFMSKFFVYWFIQNYKASERMQGRDVFPNVLFNAEKELILDCTHTFAEPLRNMFKDKIWPCINFSGDNTTSLTPNMSELENIITVQDISRDVVSASKYHTDVRNEAALNLRVPLFNTEHSLRALTYNMMHDDVNAIVNPAEKAALQQFYFTFKKQGIQVCSQISAIQKIHILLSTPEINAYYEEKDFDVLTHSKFDQIANAERRPYDPDKYFKTPGIEPNKRLDIFKKEYDIKEISERMLTIQDPCLSFAQTFFPPFCFNCKTSTVSCLEAIQDDLFMVEEIKYDAETRNKIFEVPSKFKKWYHNIILTQLKQNNNSLASYDVTQHGKNPFFKNFTEQEGLYRPNVDYTYTPIPRNPETPEELDTIPLDIDHRVGENEDWNPLNEEQILLFEILCTYFLISTSNSDTRNQKILFLYKRFEVLREYYLPYKIWKTDQKNPMSQTGRLQNRKSLLHEDYAKDVLVSLAKYETKNAPTHLFLDYSELIESSPTAEEFRLSGTIINYNLKVMNGMIPVVTQDEWPYHKIKDDKIKAVADLFFKNEEVVARAVYLAWSWKWIAIKWTWQSLFRWFVKSHTLLQHEEVE